ncbi:MAG: P-loop NTPase family protein [Gemmataceae bacterium]
MPAPTEDVEPMLAAAEEIPFIEVGPRKSMEASPSVLACPPSSSGEWRVASGEKEGLSSLAACHSPLAAHEPRSVQFRPLPSRAARSAFASELAAYHTPNDSTVQQFRQVHDAVLNACATNDRPLALLFASALPRCGTTTTLLNIGIIAAGQRRQGVVVVDANYRRPAVAERLGLAAAPGLREAMAGAVALDKVIQPTEQANLFALTAGLPPLYPAPRAGGDKGGGGIRFVAETLRSLLRQLRQRYSLVLVDGPRWDGNAEAAALGAACDAVFLVAPESESETPQTDALLRRIAEQGAHLAGCILVADL